MRFEGKTALITGGTSGLGLAAAKRFVRDGGRVAVVGRDPARGKEAVELLNGSGSASYIQGNLGEDGEPARVADEAQKLLGQVDVLVNCAGELYFGTVTEPDAESYLKMVRTNQVAPYLLTAFLAPGMVERGNGRIINVTTMSTHAGIPNIGMYTATKAALASYTQTCAAELAASGVNVNAVAPGPVPTPMGETFREGQDALAAMLPAKRKGTEDEIAAGILFLASPEASYIHGITLFVDGGWAAT